MKERESSVIIPTRYPLKEKYVKVISIESKKSIKMKYK